MGQSDARRSAPVPSEPSDAGPASSEQPETTTSDPQPPSTATSGSDRRDDPWSNTSPGEAAPASTSRSVADRLADPSLAPLVDELVRRFERGDEPVSITLPSLDPRGYGLLADLLGTDRYPVAGSRLALARLAAVAGGDLDELRATIEALRGPLTNRREEHRAAVEARRALWDDVRRAAGALDLFADEGDAAGWVERLKRAGVPNGDLDAHRDRLGHTLEILERLPADDLTLASLAADHLGDAHALDPGRRVARFVLDALAIAAGKEAPEDAEAVRRLWETAGVVVDPLSSTVLTLGLRAEGDDPLTTFLNRSAAIGEPVVLTYGQLTRWPPTVAAGQPDTFMFENPTLLIEASASGWHGPPLLCSSGRPSVATVTLVRRLRSSGTAVRQHADFDPAGLAITTWLTERAGTVPWQMTAKDYEQAVRTTDGHLPITGPVPETPWDPNLASTMETAGVAVHEEAIRARLLGDLGGAEGASG